jgi:hypothetical protein
VCRNIKTLFNFEPPATRDEVRDASTQFVRKLSGSTKPSKINQVAFDQAVDDIAITVMNLLDTLVTSAPPKDRQREAERARIRTEQRFGSTQ